VPPYLPDNAETRKDLAHYYDEISRLDVNVGKVLDEITLQGLADDTVVIFMTDNGRPFPRCKTTLYDSGIKSPFIIRWLGWIPIFAGPSYGIGLFSAGIILTIMILPTIVAISREVITTVPNSQREAMAALGATRWEVVRGAVLPYARSGIIGAVILGLGRALGETMAVTMVIGNAQNIPSRLFDQGQTIASKIATTFNEASIGLQTSALIYLGLILLVITIAMNVLARLLVRRVGSEGART